MRKYLSGFVTGAIVALVFSASAATFVGSSGYLNGWDVEVNGDTVCSDPYIWPGTRTIECD